MLRIENEVEKILLERFGKDSILALATTAGTMPYVRNVHFMYLPMPCPAR